MLGNGVRATFTFLLACLELVTVSTGEWPWSQSLSLKATLLHPNDSVSPRTKFAPPWSWGFNTSVLLSAPWSRVSTPRAVSDLLAATCHSEMTVTARVTYKSSLIFK